MIASHISRRSTHSLPAQADVVPIVSRSPSTRRSPSARRRSADRPGSREGLVAARPPTERVRTRAAFGRNVVGESVGDAISPYDARDADPPVDLAASSVDAGMDCPRRRLCRPLPPRQLVDVRESTGNADIALLILAAVLVVAMSRRPGPVVVAAGSAALSYDFFHTVPYHSFTIANGNDQVATLVLGLLALGIGLAATRAARSYEELVLIVAVATMSQAVPEPARLIVSHSGLDACLAVLVFVTALSIPISAFASLGSHLRRIGVAICWDAGASGARVGGLTTGRRRGLAPRSAGGWPRSHGDRLGRRGVIGRR